MSIFKIALDVEEGLFFDFGVGSISLGRPSWLEGMELHGWFLDGWFFGCIVVGRLFLVMALLKDCPVRTDWLGVLLLLSVIFLVFFAAIDR
jgi:hypothetical protein